MSKHQEMQKFIRYYKDQTNEIEVDMHKVAAFAEKKGWVLPKPISPLEALAKQFATAAREEIKYDKTTGLPYRVNHSYPHKQGETTLHLWIDIDEASREPMRKSLVLRREQMIGDGLQLTLDFEHWNRVHPNEEPITLPMDFGPDIEWRKNSSEADTGVA
jgi:hypothetical protein